MRAISRLRGLRAMNAPHHLLLISAALLIGTSSAFAVTMPHVFGDHMVLQSGPPVPVRGWAKPGETVTVSFAGQKKQTTAAGVLGTQYLSPLPFAVGGRTGFAAVQGAAEGLLQALHEHLIAKRAAGSKMAS
jgi:sialate O-acetylesterase